MRDLADKARIEAFLAALSRATDAETEVFLVGGTSAVIVGWRHTTIDIDLAIRPDSDAILRAIPELKERLRVNVELASPDMFLPIPQGWEQRSPMVSRSGHVTIRHFDFSAQALAKIERGHTQDVADVHAMHERRLIAPATIREQFAQMEAQFYRFPAIDPRSFRRALDAIFPA